MLEGELPVGQAVVLETGHGTIPFLVAAPTLSGQSVSPNAVGR
jgi:hypothetical protein